MLFLKNLLYGNITFTCNRIGNGILDDVLDPMHDIVIPTALIIVDQPSKNLIAIGSDVFYGFA